MPVMAPARNAMVRPCCSPLLAASAVRTLARTEMFIPTKPVAPDSKAPSTKPLADSAPRKKNTSAATTTPTIGDGRVLAAQIG